MEKKHRQWSLPAVLIALSLLPLLAFASHVSARYTSWEDLTINEFSHMTVHESTEKVYIGATNRIIQLSQDLIPESSVTMGPQDDSPNCPATKTCPRESKKPTDYFNKAILVDYSNGKLIACGSLFQGLCTTHDLNDVSKYDTPANEPVVANTETASTVAFIEHGLKGQNQVLYLGVTYTGAGPYRSDVPALSRRSLEASKMFTTPRSKNRMYVNSLERDTYRITYVYGFGSEGFSYFVTVQKRTEDSSSPFLSKLVRVCQQDENYYSYTEVHLVCKAQDGTDYNLAQAAYVGHPGSELAHSLQISKEDSVLFVVFAKAKGGEKGNHSMPSQNSALCVYSLPAIRRKFTENIQRCFNGEVERGLDFITPSFRCVPTTLVISDDFCGINVNTPIDGTLPIEAAPVLHFPGTLLTAVAATSTQGYTVAFLGTSTGHLKKAVVETGTRASEYRDIMIEEGVPVKADMVFDKAKDNIYVMTKRKVTKVKVEECDAFQTCTECLGAGDPYCGWCSLENRCLSRKACAETPHDSLCWLSYKSKQCYIFTEIQLPSPITSDETTGDRQSPGHPMDTAGRSIINMEESKLLTLRDIAKSMRNIASLLKELTEQRKENK